MRHLSGCKYLYLGNAITGIIISYVVIKIRVMNSLETSSKAPVLKSSEFQLELSLDVTE